MVGCSYWLTVHRRPGTENQSCFLKYIVYFVDSQDNKIDEELKELDEGHDGEAEPETEHSTWVGDVLKQLKKTQRVTDCSRMHGPLREGSVHIIYPCSRPVLTGRVYTYDTIRYVD